MFSFFEIVESLENLEEIEISSKGLAVIAGILGLRHLMKKGKERDAMMYCKSECAGVLDRREWEKCVTDCFNRKMTVSKFA